jgi:mitochondrial fission protein ELM1
LLTREGRAQPIRIWALLGARAGDNDQVLALAEAVGLPFETKQLEYNRLRHLGPRLLGASFASLTARSRGALLAEPPPDLTISAGHRSVAVVRALRRRSGGRTRSVHVGFPRVSPRFFDLVIATPQYPIPDHPNLMRVPYALTRISTGGSDGSDDPELQQLPKPLGLLVVGGPTVFWKLNENLLLETLSTMLAEAADQGGSVVVTTSPRTPLSVREAIAKGLRASRTPSLLASPGKPPRYASLLGAADSIRVTADSVAMVSDAIWTGKPMALVPVTRSVPGRLGITLMDALRGGLYPQDLRRFWHRLATMSVSERLAVPRTSTKAQMRAILDRVKPIPDQVA